MMYLIFHMFFVFLFTRPTISMTFQNKDYNYFAKGEPESEIVDFIVAKGYLPNDKDLPKPSLTKKNENDEMYLLSKLSDDEIIKLLSDKSMKTDFDVKDIIKVALEGNPSKQNLVLSRTEHPFHEKAIKINSKKADDARGAYFRLEDKQVEPQLQNEAEYNALKKLKHLLYTVPQKELKNDGIIDDANKELLFDILVSQLKALCCGQSKRQDPNIIFKSTKQLSELKPLSYQKPHEFMFLVINDEIESKSGELTSVDPESLQQNSSVLLLGPITTPLTDGQLLLVMNKISTELSKPEYATLLQQLSDGTLSENNKSLIKNFIYGPETRRYIKPHRCNHQSKLARIYGGPKWLICTGYININTPSLYD